MKCYIDWKKKKSFRGSRLSGTKLWTFFPTENGEGPEAFEQGKNSARHQEVNCVPNK